MSKRDYYKRESPKVPPKIVIKSKGNEIRDVEVE